MENYTALIIDLKKSRAYSIDDRNAIQNYIVTVIESLNEVFAGSLTREVAFSAGDEVQGLFRSPEPAYLYFRLFCMLVSPVEIRAGIGVGEWNVKIEHASTTAQDGPAYHHARKAIGNVKDAPGYALLLCTGTENDLFFNAVINSPFAWTNSYSEYQNELMLILEFLYPVTYQGKPDYNKMVQLSNLIKLRNSLDYYRDTKKSKAVKKYPLEGIVSTEFKTIPVDAGEAESSFYVSGGKKRGMTTEVSELLQISRQSIEKTFKTAHIYEARNAAIAAVKFMEKYL